MSPDGLEMLSTPVPASPPTHLQNVVWATLTGLVLWSLRGGVEGEQVSGRLGWAICPHEEARDLEIAPPSFVYPPTKGSGLLLGGGDTAASTGSPAWSESRAPGSASR